MSEQLSEQLDELDIQYQQLQQVEEKVVVNVPVKQNMIAFHGLSHIFNYEVLR